MRSTRKLLAFSTGVHKQGTSIHGATQHHIPDIGTDGFPIPKTKERKMFRRDVETFGKADLNVSTRYKKNPESEISRDYFGAPPYSPRGTHASMTDRRTGFMVKYPTRKYPNPKRFKPVMVSPRISMREPEVSPKTLVSRRYLPMEKKGKRIVMNMEYHRMVPVLKRQRKEVYLRLKFGLYDLDRILPPLWGPQEGNKLDRDEWLFKLMYFLHPIKEDELVQKVGFFPHNPFDTSKEVILSLERLVSREYCRRLVGKNINGGFGLERDAYYWTLMPDELDFGEKVVIDEDLMESMWDPNKSVNVSNVTDDMCKISYQQQHNTYLHLRESNDIGELERFVSFCDDEIAETKVKLDDINKGYEIEEDNDESEEEVYPHPLQLFSLNIGKKAHHHVGHWSQSIPDNNRPHVPLGLRSSA